MMAEAAARLAVAEACAVEAGQLVLRSICEREASSSTTIAFRTKASVVDPVTEVDEEFNRLYIHFDGWSGDWDFWTSHDSGFIAPIGTSKEKGLRLDSPRGYLKGAQTSPFEWSRYLSER